MNNPIIDRARKEGKRGEIIAALQTLNYETAELEKLIKTHSGSDSKKWKEFAEAAAHVEKSVQEFREMFKQ